MNEEKELRLDDPLLTTQQLDEYPEDKLSEAMNKDMMSMKAFDVYYELLASNLTPDQLQRVIKSRWVLRWKGDEIRATLVAKTYSQDITDLETYASTPLLLTLRKRLLIALNRGWKVLFGDVSTAFLLPENEEILVEAPQEYYPKDRQRVLWKLRRPLYGLQTAPKQWQDYFATVLADLGGKRLKSEPNVYSFATTGNYVLVYVDDIVVLGPDPQPL